MEWIVIVNRMGAKIYGWDEEEKRLKLRFSFSNPLGRLKNRSLMRDQPGQRRSRLKTSPSHRLTRERDPHDEAVNQFVRGVVQTLRKRMVLDQELTIKVVAEAKLLGKIRSEFPSHFRSRVAWIGKDLGKIPEIKWPALLGLEVRPSAMQGVSRFPI